MTWSEHHTRSERLAARAKERARTSVTAAKALYRQAAAEEALALESLDRSKARTRGITAVSAASLWFKAGEFAHVEPLIFGVLADPEIPMFARDDLRRLLQSTWIEAAKKAAKVDFLEGQVMVSVKGGSVIAGGAPLELILDKVQTIQSMFYRTIEWVRGDEHRRIGRPAQEVLESCQPWLFQEAPASYAFSVAVQKPPQAHFWRKDAQPSAIANEFLRIVKASTDEDPQAIADVVPDSAYRKTFLHLARSLSPQGDVFERIEFRGAGDASGPCLDATTRVTIGKHLRPPKSPKSSDAPQTIRGILRAVDLNKNWLVVDEGTVSRRVSGLQDTVDDVIGPMVNREVVLEVRQRGKQLHYVDIQLAG